MADIFIEMSKDIGSATCEKMTLGFHKWDILIKPTLANNNLIILLYISSIVVICGNYTIKSMWTSEDTVITKDVMHFQTHLFWASMQSGRLVIFQINTENHLEGQWS